MRRSTTEQGYETNETTSRHLAIARAVLTAGVILSTGAVAPLGAQQKTTQRYAVTPTVSIRFFGDVGRLRIIGWDRDSVVITATLPAGARLDAPRAGEKGRPSPGMKIYVEIPRPPAPDATLELRVPARARIWAKSGSAEVDVTGLTGGLDVNIVGGSVRVAGSPAELQIESMDGSVTVEGSPTWLRVKTATGDIMLRGGSEDAALSTVSGAMRVADGRFDRAKFTSVTGSIVFAGDLARGAAIDFDTHAGPIDLGFPAQLDADVDVASITGRIDNMFNGRRPIVGREGRGMELAFTAGTGRARIHVRTFKGSVQLRAR